MFDYAESPLCTIWRFRINELTSNVPFAVRSVLRNDNVEAKIRIISVVCKTTTIIYYNLLTFNKIQFNIDKNCVYTQKFSIRLLQLKKL